MTQDLSGGIPAAREYFFADRPGEPEMRDAANVWIQEENGAFGMRIGVESNSSGRDLPEIYLDIAFSDGRVMSRRSDEQAHDRIGADGRASILGGGPVRFQVIKPFDEWVVSFDGTAAEITAQELIKTPYPEEKIIKPVSFEIRMKMAVPPWLPGAMLPEEQKAAFQKNSADFISPRYEQLFRCEGRVSIGGEEKNFRGQGLRIRRQGLRKFADFPGHVWQSCLFPSGKAFGFNTFGTYQDAAPSYAEAYYYDGHGELIPAKLVEIPWLSQLRVSGDNVPIGIEVGGRPIRIEGTSFVNCRSRFPKSLPAGVAGDYPTIQQSHVHYRLGDEKATGMMERSTPPSKLKP